MAATLFLALLVGLSGSTPSAKPVGACLYFIDGKDGHVWRSRVDGTGREVVIRCGAVKSGRLSPSVGLVTTWPSVLTSGALHLTSIPYGEGYTVLDGARPRLFNARAQIEGELPLVYTDTPKQSAWTVVGRYSSHQMEPRHYHDRLTSIEMRRAGKTVVFRVAGPHDRVSSAFLGLVSSDQAVLADNHMIWLWDLRTDRKRPVASAVSAVLWPRDLSKPARFAPVAKTLLRVGHAGPGLKPGVYRWAVKTPDDFRIRPEYLVKAMKY
jgi:hypothetical protein